MKRFLFLFLLLLPVIAFSQVATDSVAPVQKDSLPKPDTTVRRDPLIKDSLHQVVIDSTALIDSPVVLSPVVPPAVAKPVVPELPIHLKKFEGKETLFYSLVGLLLLFALLRQAFAKYFADLFRLFFRTTLKQRQIREQLMQTPLPSLLFNAFFVISAGLYCDFMLIHFKLIDTHHFWIYFLYCCLGLSAAYFVKFVGLKILGWIFNLQEAASSYIFVVFVINKVIGIFLLPFNIMLAFMEGDSYQAAVVLSWLGVGALILYRYILTFASVRNQVRFNPFHFFLYLCAFEIAPLLLIYKLLLVIFR